METFKRHTITDFNDRPIYGDQYFFWERNTVKRSIWSGAEYDICRWHDKNVFFAERQAIDDPKHSAERDYAFSFKTETVGATMWRSYRLQLNKRSCRRAAQIWLTPSQPFRNRIVGEFLLLRRIMHKTIR